MITLITGPMKSGKSTEMYRQMERKHLAGKKVLYIGPSLDNRDFYARGIPKSRLQEVADVIVLTDWCKLSNTKLKDILNNYDSIFIDEYFMIKHNVRICKILPDDNNHKCDIYFGGLIADANAKTWPEYLEISPYCDEIIKLSAVCEDCGSEHANYSAFMGDLKEGEIIVGDTQYKALCRKCFLKRMELNGD